MKKLLFLLFAVGLISLSSCSKSKHDPIAPTVQPSPQSLLPVWDQNYRTSFSETYDSGVPEDEEKELEGVQCPIPMSDRVRNHTGIQCVFASIECIGRWAEEPKLMNPPLTSRSDCKSYSGPSDAASKLTKYGVKFEQEYRDREAGIALIKKAMRDGRGCLWGVPGHAMTLIHYDEANDTVKWIDNSDRSLRVQTTTIDKFKRRWDGWVLVIYADHDLFPGKAMGLTLPNRIPIVDQNEQQGQYPPDYIPVPQK